MKIYKTTTTGLDKKGNPIGDTFAIYIGKDEKEAINKAEKEWERTPIHYKKTIQIEVEIWETEEELELNNEYEFYEAIENLYDCDILLTINYNSFSVKLKEKLKSCKLNEREFAEKLGVPLRTYESWIRGLRTPDQFKQRFILEEAEKIREENE